MAQPPTRSGTAPRGRAGSLSHLHLPRACLWLLVTSLVAAQLARTAVAAPARATARAAAAAPQPAAAAAASGNAATGANVHTARIIDTPTLPVACPRGMRAVGRRCQSSSFQITSRISFIRTPGFSLQTSSLKQLHRSNRISFVSSLVGGADLR
ncbi:Protein of unknown function [Gryllus bimaculatus]|nr:Protein of unknown function [Gryllus bimaculatus]